MPSREAALTTRPSDTFTHAPPCPFLARGASQGRPLDTRHTPERRATEPVTALTSCRSAHASSREIIPATSEDGDDGHLRVDPRRRRQRLLLAPAGPRA